jgi:hypothetical protein
MRRLALELDEEVLEEPIAATIPLELTRLSLLAASICARWKHSKGDAGDAHKEGDDVLAVGRGASADEA